jgi:hypothetical protein
MRFDGVLLIISRTCSSDDGHIFDFTYHGLIQFAVIPYSPHSSAIDFVNHTSACLALE